MLKLNINSSTLKTHHVPKKNLQILNEFSKRIDYHFKCSVTEL